MLALKMSDTTQLPTQLQQQLGVARSRGESIILATGVFDLFHQEHAAFLRKAKALGGFLIVGVESDVRVKVLKGPGRPRQPESERWQTIVSQPMVDAAVILPEAFDQPHHYRELLETIQPHYLAVSSHSPHLDKKQALMESIGGELKVVHVHNPAVSTTQLLAQNA